MRNARLSDPNTSKAAQHAIKLTNALKILRVFARVGMATDEQASRLAGINQGWKRCSDLRRDGYIAPVYEDDVLVTKRSSAGVDVMVCRITDKGLRKLDEVMGR